MIIDTHVHLGSDSTFDSTHTEDELKATMDEVGIDIMLVQPCQHNTYLEVTRSAHNRIAKFARNYPKRIYGVCSVNPHYELDVYEGEIRRCIHELGFVGIKVVSHCHCWSPLVKRGSVPFKIAQKLDIPIMLHTDYAGFRTFATPSNFFYRIKEYSDVTIILSHASGMLYHTYAILAKKFPNVYLQVGARTSVSNALKYFVKEIGANRIMLGTDNPTDEMEHNLWMFRHSGLTDEELEWTLSRTAQQVFKLP